MFVCAVFSSADVPSASINELLSFEKGKEDSDHCCPVKIIRVDPADL